MIILQAIIIGILGVLVGAFFSHWAEAIMTKRKLALPLCPYCQTPCPRTQWIALVALFTGQRKCAYCDKPIRHARWVGELYVAGFWVALVLRYGLTWRTLLSMVALLPMAMITVTDLETKLVPHKITFPSMGAMLLVGTLTRTALASGPSTHWYDTLLGAVVAMVILRLLIWLGVAIFGPGALGEGDMTLATYIGAVVGFPLILEALILGILIGGVGVLIVLITRKGNLKTAVPYGPFLILGGTITMIWGQAILNWYLH